VKIVIIDIIVLDTSFTIQCISELNGAIKNNTLANINTQIASNISLFLNDKNNQPNATIKLYQINV
jgi:hypothetical protein